jgi:tRNA modification GTPase
VSVLRVEGADALERVRALAPGARLEPGAPCFARLVLAGEGLDEALIQVEGPERLELHLHGSPPLVRLVAEQLAGPAGASPHAPARSLEERAAALLPGAPCEAGARILLDQMEGALRAALAPLVDAPDGDVQAQLERLAESARVAAPALRPLRVVLAGPVNAGKSTLFNVLVGSRRVVTSVEHGTTRDAIHERARLGAWPVEWIDTAGERQAPGGAAGAVEVAGQALARELREGADLVFWLARDGTPPPDTDPSGGASGAPVVTLRTFADLGPGPPAVASLSALAEPERAVEVVERAFRAALALPEDPWTRGAPVPFEPALAQELGALGPLSSPERRSRLAELLAR